MSENMDEDVLIQLSVSDHLQRQIFDAFQSIPQLVQGRLYSFFLCVHGLNTTQQPTSLYAV
jgi:hypothetical protein